MYLSPAICRMLHLAYQLGPLQVHLPVRACLLSCRGAGRVSQVMFSRVACSRSFRASP